MPTGNTGRKIYARLKRVSDDVNEYPLDASDIRTDISGQPQAVKDNNTGDPDYVAPVTDTVTCPLPE